MQMAKQQDYVRYTIRLPAELYGRIQAAAGEKSVNAEIAERLARSFAPPAERILALLIQMREELDKLTVTLKLTGEELELLDKEASKRGTTMGDIITTILERAIEEIMSGSETGKQLEREIDAIIESEKLKNLGQQ